MATSPLRILVIGAGSMGTRRLRDLAERQDVTLAVFDERTDRRERARERFGIPACEDLAAVLAWEPSALVISTPPDQHAQYVDLALERRLHHFCEAHVWTPDAGRIDGFSRREGLVCASSCSMDFLPVVRRLRELVARELGAVHAYQVYLSTWLPGWHPTEPDGFYAWRPATTAAREMVPFELLYLNTIFGTPVAVAGTLARRGELAVDGPDMWCLQMQLEDGGCGQFTVLMGSPAETRRGCCYGGSGGAVFDIAAGEITILRGRTDSARITCGSIRETVETAYREEISTFVDAIVQRTKWPCPYARSAAATATLAAAERSAATGRWERVDPAVQPGHLPWTADRAP